MIQSKKYLFALAFALSCFVMCGMIAPPPQTERRSRDILLEEIEYISKDSLETRWFARWIYEKGRQEEARGELDNAWACYELYPVALKYNLSVELFALSERERQEYWRTVAPCLKDIQRFALEHIRRYPAIALLAYECELFSKSRLLTANLSIKKSIENSGDYGLISLWERAMRLKEQMEMIDSNLEYAHVAIAREAAADTASSQRIDSLTMAMERYSNVYNTIQQVERGLAKIIGASQVELPDDYAYTWEDVRSALGSNRAVVEYFTCPDPAGDDLYYAFVGSGTMQYPRVVSIGSATRVASCLGQKIAYEELYNTLWLPLEPFLRFAREVYIVPAGIVHTVPFSGLSSSNGYICDRFAIRRVLSARDIIEDTQKDKLFENKSAIIIGGPEFDFAVDGLSAGEVGNINMFENQILHDGLRSSRGQGYAYLPWSLAESEALHRLLLSDGWEVELLTDTQATKIALQRTLSEQCPNILHISTHGFYIPEQHKAEEGENRNIFRIARNPLMRTGLALAGANVHWNQPYDYSVSDNGILTGLEISRFDLSGIDLVILAACKTGQGTIDNFEGVFGLQRAFRMAGVRNMIVSLWDIPDKETSEIMTSFYKHILGGYPLRQAFDTAIRKARHKYPSQPQFWAGFVLVE